ncbi:MAG TPA: hypothetical protein H9880_04975 [Candidatus Anaerobutyricum avicola]|nr:hypothetical protein [Candidatus Anaerobutyricum avicola]
MFSDFVTFITDLPGQLMHTGTFLPDSFESGAEHLQTIGSYIDGIDTTYKIIGTAITLIIALLGCFFGFKLSKLFMSLTGLLVGAIAGGGIASAFLDGSTAMTAGCALVGAIILSILAYRIYQAGIFVLCFGLSFMAAASILPFTGDIQFFLSVVVGFVVGSLALKFIRPVIIITSAVVCGSSAAGCLTVLGQYMDMDMLSSYSLLLTAGLIILGILVQFLTTGGKH